MSTSSDISLFIDREKAIRARMGEEKWQRERARDYNETIARLARGITMDDAIRSGQRIVLDGDRVDIMARRAD